MVRQALYIACPIPSRMIGGPAGEDVVSVVQPISSTLTAGTKPSGLHLPSFLKMGIWLLCPREFSAYYFTKITSSHFCLLPFCYLSYEHHHYLISFVHLF